MVSNKTWGKSFENSKSGENRGIYRFQHHHPIWYEHWLLTVLSCYFSLEQESENQAAQGPSQAHHLVFIKTLTEHDHDL